MIRAMFPEGFLRVSGSSSDVLFGIKIFGNRFFKQSWFQMTVMRAYGLARRAHDVRLWFYYRCSKDGRACWLPAGVSPGYYDCDELILRYCMGALCRYIEDECGGVDKLEEFTEELRPAGSEGFGPRECIDSQTATQAGATDIYRWWKFQRPADVARESELLRATYGTRRKTGERFSPEQAAMVREMGALKDKVAQEDQAYLRRLIDIRRGLWT